jgi:hypothetical protein
MHVCHAYVCMYVHICHVLISPPPCDYRGKTKNIFFIAREAPQGSTLVTSYKFIFYFFPITLHRKNGRELN